MRALSGFVYDGGVAESTGIRRQGPELTVVLGGVFVLTGYRCHEGIDGAQRLLRCIYYHKLAMEQARERCNSA